jgi:hypothetical protein
MEKQNFQKALVAVSISEPNCYHSTMIRQGRKQRASALARKPSTKVRGLDGVGHVTRPGTAEIT